MEQRYWLGRKRASLANARGARSAVSRLIHLDLAGRYSIKAALGCPAAAGRDAGVALALPPPERGDAEHYERLETGARWLASRAANEAEANEHLAMATKYARLRVDAVGDRRR
jgi:hypothetical protein